MQSYRPRPLAALLFTLATVTFMALGVPGRVDTVLALESKTSAVTLEYSAGAESQLHLARAVAAPDLPELTVSAIASGLNNPWDVAFTPDGTLIFDELRGGIGAVVPSGEVRTLATPDAFPDNFTGNESGVMGIAVDPDFATNRIIYVCQTLAGPDPGNPGAGARNAVIKWRVNANYTTASRQGTIVDGLMPAPLADDPQGGQGRHVGCRLRLDAAGLLYISVGDGRTPTGPEDLTSPVGKVLRVTRTGEPAPGNPFAANANAVARKVFTYGHRNPQGLAFDPADDALWETEHGPDKDDEINLLSAGSDYGWNPLAPDGSYRDNGTPMTRSGARTAAWSSGDPTVATSGATFLSGAQWGAWDGALAVATLKGVSLHLFSVDAGAQHTRAAAKSATQQESATVVIDRSALQPADEVAATAIADSAAAAADPDATSETGTAHSDTSVDNDEADPIGTALDGTFGRLRTAQIGPDGAIYLTTSNGGFQDHILRVVAGQHCAAPTDDPTPAGVALISTGAGSTAFVRGTDDAVWYRRTDMAAQYETLGGTINYGPAAVSTSSGEQDVFVVGTDHGLYYRSASPGVPWSGWQQLGGLLSATPAAVSVSGNRVDVFGRGIDGALWTISRVGGNWSNWSLLGGALAAAPGASADSITGSATVGVRGTDGGLYQLEFSSAGPGTDIVAFRNVGTQLCSSPAYAYRIGDGAAAEISYRLGDFSVTVDDQSIGGIVTSAPALIATDGSSGFSVIGRGGDDALWMYQESAGTGTWTSLGGRLR